MKKNSKGIVRYDSLTEFSESLPKTTPRANHDLDEIDEWSGKQTYSEARARLWSGFPEAVKRSDAILEKLESEGIELKQQSWDTELQGYFPCVPAFVSGDPDCMFIPVDEQSNTAPMRVFASVCLSAGFSKQELETRGIAILALVRKLSLIRPVEFWLYGDMYGSQPCIRIETLPMDLTSASYAISNAGFLRKLCFGWGYDGRGFDGSWASWGGHMPIEKAREALGATNDDLVIPGSYLNRDDLKDPVKWVNNRVVKYTGLEKSEAC